MELQFLGLDISPLFSSESSPPIFLSHLLWPLPPRPSDLQAERPFAIWLLLLTHLISAGDERLSETEGSIIKNLKIITLQTLKGNWYYWVSVGCYLLRKRRHLSDDRQAENTTSWKNSKSTPRAAEGGQTTERKDTQGTHTPKGQVERSICDYNSSRKTRLKRQSSQGKTTQGNCHKSEG